MHHIAVIDYGMGNLRSVSKALEAVSSNASVVVTSDPKPFFLPVMFYFRVSAQFVIVWRNLNSWN